MRMTAIGFNDDVTSNDFVPFIKISQHRIL